jgi:protein STE50
VQCDPSGAGLVDADTSKQGWVPAGCLLETCVPFAPAIAATRASSSSPDVIYNDPIMPHLILGTSYSGLALADYRCKGTQELDIAKDERVKVFKKYNHWSYVVKEENGERGWVPVRVFFGHFPSFSC